MFDRLEDWCRLHHHAGPTAEAVVVDLAMLVVGVVADIVETDLDQALALSSGNDALRHRALEHSGEKRQHVEAHGSRYSSPPTGCRWPPLTRLFGATA